MCVLTAAISQVGKQVPVAIIRRHDVKVYFQLVLICFDGRGRTALHYHHLQLRLTVFITIAGRKYVSKLKTSIG